MKSFFRVSIIGVLLLAGNAAVGQCPTASGFGGRTWAANETQTGTCVQNPGGFLDSQTQGSTAGGNDPTLTINGNVTIEGNLYVLDQIIVNGTLTVTGTITVDSDAQITINSGGTVSATTLTNSGSLLGGLGNSTQVSVAGELNVTTINNNENGNITVNGGGSVTATTVNNNDGGDITIESGGALGTDTFNDNTGSSLTIEDAGADQTCGDNGCCGDCGVLPVELIEFTGLVENSAVILRWSTATEINNAYFEIEKSSDGTEFVVIGTVEGFGNTSERIDYSYTDFNIQSKYTFYRLRQVDFDGQYEYHPTIMITNELSALDGQINVLPNPVKCIL
jgi:cytoskeletal protein CcmA (bactofilin family)